MAEKKSLMPFQADVIPSVIFVQIPTKKSAIEFHISRAFSLSISQFFTIQTREDYAKFMADYDSKLPESAPDEYSQRNGNVKMVQITDELFKQLSATDCGMFIFQPKFEKYKNEGKIIF